MPRSAVPILCCYLAIKPPFLSLLSYRLKPPLQSQACAPDLKV